MITYCDQCLRMYIDALPECPTFGCNSHQTIVVELNDSLSELPRQSVKYLSSARNWVYITRTVVNPHQTGLASKTWSGTPMVQWKGEVTFQFQKWEVTGWVVDSFERSPEVWTLGDC